MEEYKGLRRLRAYKEQILETVISDDNLVKAIANNNTTFLTREVPNPANLIYKQIFPYKWTLPEIPDTKEVYITMNFNIGRLQGGIFNEIAFSIYVFVHKDIMRVDTGDKVMLRSDYIMERLEDLFHDHPGFGIGRLQLISTGEIFISTDIPGFYLTFATVDQAQNK